MFRAPKRTSEQGGAALVEKWKPITETFWPVEALLAADRLAFSALPPIDAEIIEEMRLADRDLRAKEEQAGSIESALVDVRKRLDTKRGELATVETSFAELSKSSFAGSPGDSRKLDELLLSARRIGGEIAAGESVVATHEANHATVKAAIADQSIVVRSARTALVREQLAHAEAKVRLAIVEAFDEMRRTLDQALGEYRTVHSIARDLDAIPYNSHSHASPDARLATLFQRWIDGQRKRPDLGAE